MTFDDHNTEQYRESVEVYLTERDEHTQMTNELKPATGDYRNKVNAGNQSEMIVAKVPQGYETNINVRLLPGRDFKTTTKLKLKGCQPRRGAPRRDAEPLDLPPDLIDKLKNANKAVVAWLALDETNARLFMVRPAEALINAGVNLTRADQKAIERTHSEVREVTMVAPGVKVVGFTVATSPHSQVGKIRPGTKPQDKRNSNTGSECAKEDSHST